MAQSVGSHASNPHAAVEMSDVPAPLSPRSPGPAAALLDGPPPPSVWCGASWVAACVRQAHRFYEWYCGRVMEDGDSEAMQQRKLAVGAISAMTFCFGTFNVTQEAVRVEGGDVTGMELYWVWIPLCIAHAGVTLLYLFATRCMNDVSFALYLLVMMLWAVLFDLHQASMMAARAAPIFVVVIDLLLIGRLNNTVTFTLFAAALVWQLTIQGDLAFRFGLLDVWGTATVDQRKQMCDCEHPPCTIAIATATRGGLLPIWVFLLDFYVTRMFAHRVAAEQAVMCNAIATAREIADALAKFDLDRAAGGLNGEPDLPDDLRAALATILENLQSYRPYLPSQLFHSDAGSEQGVEATIPGVSGDPVAIMFTDIRQSTSLWEHSPAAMEVALKTHNSIIRAAVASASGYEVKTIGDAFMVAFFHPAEAVQCACEVQEQFARSGTFPQALTRARQDDGFDVFSIRIGIHYGDAAVEMNALTGRYDFFGSTVNKAARVEAFGAPGGVTVTPECMEELRNRPDALKDVRVLPYTEGRWAKGITKALVLTALLPEGAAQKEAIVRRTTDAAKTPPPQPIIVGETGAAARIARSPALVGLRARLMPQSPAAQPCLLPPRQGTDTLSAAPSSVTTATPSRTSDGFRVPRLPRGEGSASRSASVCALQVNVFAGWDDACDLWRDTCTATSARLEVVQRLLTKTQGSLTTVVGSTVYVEWGGHKKCGQHVSLSSRFLLLLYQHQRSRAGTRPWFHAGLASGPLQSGSVFASAQQRFVTVLGPCVDLAAALHHGAAELGTWALAASIANRPSERYHTHATLGDHVRAVDAWRIGGSRAAEDSAALGGSCVSPHDLRLEITGAPSAVRVYEVCLATLAHALSPDAEDDAPEVCGIDSTAWGDVYHAAFAEKDVALLRTWADDPVVAKVADLVECGSHLQHAGTFYRQPEASLSLPRGQT